MIIHIQSDVIKILLHEYYYNVLEHYAIMRQSNWVSRIHFICSKCLVINQVINLSTHMAMKN